MREVVVLVPMIISTGKLFRASRHAGDAPCLAAFYDVEQSDAGSFARVVRDSPEKNSTFGTIITGRGACVGQDCQALDANFTQSLDSTLRSGGLDL